MYGASPKQWIIYRGDEFQLELPPLEAMMAMLMIKATLKNLKLDARMSIGLGDKTFSAAKVSESNGSAFIRSGESFDELKNQKISIAINSGNEIWDREMNLVLRLVETITNGWLQQSAAFMLVAIPNPGFSQEQIGEQLNITQASVSRRQKRANHDLLMDVEKFYREKLNQLK